MASPAKATLTLYKPNGTDLDESVKVTADFNPQTLRLTFRTQGAVGTSSTVGFE